MTDCNLLASLVDFRLSPFSESCMVTVETLQDVQFWKSKLGLLPVPLFRDNGEGQPFVILNSARGNFCADFGHYELSDLTRNYAWSSNVGHYVSFAGNTIELQRWDEGRSRIERYSIDSVVGNLEKFHTYLENHSPRHDLSIVAHAIRIFRSLRATMGPGATGSDALRAYLYLLASETDKVERGDLIIERWRLSTASKDAATIIKDDQWNTLRHDLVRGRVHESLTPELQLLLRHASGQLFQEAHYEAMFFEQGQLLFEGFTPQPVAVSGRTSSIGLHFTPPALARTVVEETLSRLALGDSIVVFDPACGSGEFLREALRQLKSLGFRGAITLIGWDISAAACEMANFVLAWEARDCTGVLDIRIACLDSLAAQAEWPADVDWILMNPPFVSWQDMRAEQREVVRRVLGELHYQRADMSHAFIWKAAQSLREGGVLGTIAPASLLDSDAATRLRSALAEVLTPALVARLGSHALFHSAIVDAALYIAGRGAENKVPPVAFWADHRLTSNAAGLRSLRKLRSDHTRTSYPVLGEGFSIYLDPKLGLSEGSWSPRPYESWRLGQSLAGFPKVRDLFDVKQGIRTGHNPGFLLERGEYYALPESERSYFRPAVVNKSIKFGFLTDAQYVFYPYGASSIASEPELVQNLPVYAERYLLPAKTLLLARPRVNAERWWELSERRAWQNDPEPKLVSTYFGNAGSFAWDDLGNFAVVQGFAWRPRKKTDGWMRIALAYLATLNSPFFGNLLAGASTQVAGGQWNLSKKFVENISLPDYFGENVSKSFIEDLARFGSRMHAGLAINESDLNSLLAEVYRSDVTL